MTWKPKGLACSNRGSPSRYLQRLRSPSFCVACITSGRIAGRKSKSGCARCFLWKSPAGFAKRDTLKQGLQAVMLRDASIWLCAIHFGGSAYILDACVSPALVAFKPSLNTAPPVTFSSVTAVPPTPLLPAVGPPPTGHLIPSCIPMLCCCHRGCLWARWRLRCRSVPVAWPSGWAPPAVRPPLSGLKVKG